MHNHQPTSTRKIAQIAAAIVPLLLPISTLAQGDPAPGKETLAKMKVEDLYA